MAFVNRDDEIRALGAWWAGQGGKIGLIWGRRRVGKTVLLQRFAEGRLTVFHTGGGRPQADELRSLAVAASTIRPPEGRQRAFADWEDAFESLAELAAQEPLLLVLDEFPELVRVTPELPAILRAVWDRIRARTHLRILISGSAVRTMQAMQEERAPLYGRLDLVLPLHPFRPHEAAMLLPRLQPAERALVWGLVGGVPLYLEWWDQNASVRANLLRLACTPGGPLLTEGQLALATEGDLADLGRQSLYAIAAGRTKFNEIESAVRADPSRTLDRLVELRLIERLVPVTEDPRRTRRRLYRIADNFLAFWLGVLDRHRAEIERGLGGTIVNTLVTELDDHMGPRWEEAFRAHLRRMADDGRLGKDVVAIGPYFTADGQTEIDAVVLAGRGREATLVGEARWARREDAGRMRRDLERKVNALPRVREPVRFALCARDEVSGAAGSDVIAITASDIFGLPGEIRSPA